MTGIVLPGAGDEERAAAAERLAEAGRAARLAAPKPDRSAELAAAARVPGTVVHDEVVAAGAPWSGRVKAGEYLRIIDLEGCQAVDFLCFDQTDPDNRYNAGNTIKFSGNVYVGQGTTLYSDRADALMTVVADTVGLHDTIAGCCSAEANRVRYGIEGTPSCRGNFLHAFAGHGLGPQHLVANVNWFMYVPVEPDGATAIVDGRSAAGDYVDLRAERDVLVVISNCPQRYNPCNAWLPTPIRLIRWTS
ncbi:MAG: DUF1989 domain-containing protein [Geminicoccaceae bacterium]|nr:MAG: DUF1989 domain-containing protein [Geminicoccaceae bacterium]